MNEYSLRIQIIVIKAVNFSRPKSKKIRGKSSKIRGQFAGSIVVNEHWHFNLNLTSVRQYIIDDIGELHDEFLMTDDEC